MPPESVSRGAHARRHDDHLSECFCEHQIVRAWCIAQGPVWWRCTDIRDDDLVGLILRVGDIRIDELRRRLVGSVCRRKSHDLQVIHSSTTAQTPAAAAAAPLKPWSG